MSQHKRREHTFYGGLLYFPGKAIAATLGDAIIGKGSAPPKQVVPNLAAKVLPLRGGITVGMGLERYAGNFYGHALAETHHFESKKAKYPRIVLTDQPRRFVERAKGSSSNASVEGVSQQRAARCHE